jgi:hypothetical protein
MIVGFLATDQRSAAHGETRFAAPALLCADRLLVIEGPPAGGRNQVGLAPLFRSRATVKRRRMRLFGWQSALCGACMPLIRWCVTPKGARAPLLGSKAPLLGARVLLKGGQLALER